MMKGVKLHNGMTYTIQKRVVYEDITLSFGRSGVETLFATSALVGMMIEAAVDLVGKNIPEGFITVVKKMEIDHEKPTLQGMTVTVRAELDEIKGNILYFTTICYDEVGEIAIGKQERYIVNKKALIEKAHQRAESLEQKSR